MKKQNYYTSFKKIISLVVALVMTLGMTSFAFATDTPLDMEAPSDIENVVATSNDASVDLKWDVATDNVAVTGYKIYYGLDSVTSEGGEYPFDVEIGDMIEYTVDGLENDVEYFFAVTAVDEAGNESESYSLEVSATPELIEVVEEPIEGGNEQAPIVKAAESYSNVQVKITFSEPVQLPEDEPETAFLIEDSLTGDALPLLDAEVLNDSPNTVVIETQKQDIGVEYIVTAGIAVEDLNGQSIRSGTSDTASFIGGEGEFLLINIDEDTDTTVNADASDENTEALSFEDDESVAISMGNDAASDEELVDANEAIAPEVIDSVEMDEDGSVKVEFSEPVEFLDDQSHFVVSDLLGTVYNVTYEEVFTDTSVNITVENLEAGHDYLLSVMNIIDEQGNVIAGDMIPFSTESLELADLVELEDITKLFASVEDMVVKLTWTVSSSENAIEQVLYQSADGKEFLEKAVLGRDESSYEVNGLLAGMTYWFKVASRDETGNESDGVIVSVTLPETGPGLALLFGLSTAGTAFARRRKKRS